MKKNIKLLLLAALAWPGIAMAQGQVTGSLQKSVETSAVADANVDGPLPIEKVKSGDNGVEADSKHGQECSASTKRLYNKFVSAKGRKSLSPRKADASAPAIFVQKDVEDVAFVCSGSNTNQYLPVYSYYFEKSNTESQWIYPSSYFTGSDGVFKDVPDGATISISSIAFYATGTITSYVSQAEVYVRMNETKATTIGDRSQQTANLDDMGSPLFEGNLQCYSSGSNNLMIIEFAEPYVYRGGNLIIDIKIKTPATGYAQCNWYGVNTSSSTGYYYSTYYGSVEGAVKFLPQMGMIYSYNTWEATDEIDFGAIVVGETKNLSARISNPGGESITASLSTTAPFGVTPATLTMAPGMTDFSLSFAPTAATNYTGKLSLGIDGQTAMVGMKGVGYIPGTPATRDSSFFAGIEYTWPIDVEESARPEENKATLDKIATDPDQIIAMLREVYMNKDIPGNLKRGYTTSGGSESWDDVAYTGVGTMSHSGTSYDSATSYSWEDGYGWGIPGTPVYGGYDNSTRTYYAHLDSTQYRPNYEGLTVLLLEMKDDYSISDYQSAVNAGKPYASNYDMLRAQIANSIKSARVVSQAKRTGTGFDAGTLFKIDCDKMNKFFILAKGQLRYPFSSQGAFAPSGRYYSHITFCRLPCYVRSSSYYFMGSSSNGREGFIQYNSYEPIYQMFEQFSPYDLDSGEEVTDVYQELVGMESFPVPHDCASVPVVSPNGHHFRMYGENSPAADCQDVRDMMFFIPDYRMMYYSGRDTENSNIKFLNYNKSHQPTMGLYVIRQDEIVANEQAEDYYKLTLTWDSNMDEFLPGEQQKYHLLQLMQDELGNDIYVPVYYTNANGQYTDANGNVLPNQNDTTSWVPVDVVVAPSADKKTYTEVYVPRLSGSQQVTYAIQGQDVNEFLSLQVSNQQSYIIPGKDPAEMILLSDATHYSRFNPQTVKNCYSNKLKIENNPHGVRPEYLTDGTQFTFKRMTSLDDANPVTIATATVSGASATGGTLNIVMAGQNLISEFPAGKTEGEGAGYHHNPGTMDAQGNYTWTLNYRVLTQGSSAGDVDFGKFIIYDNFVEDVSANEHANQYFYKVEFTTATPFQGLNNESTSNAYSNSFRIPVYKTDSRINLAYDKAAVDADGVQVEGSEAAPERMELPENVQFDELVRRSSKTEILRYDTYRWNSEKPADFFIVDGIYGEDDEQDLPPHGIAGNQGEYYTVSMNAIGTPDYMTSETSVASGQGWAQFVDKVPHAASSASSYTYAPVVELFTKGLDVTEEALRTDYNTYGGPLQKVAVGKVDAEFVTDKGGFETSTMTWQQNGKTYCYYNLPVRLKVFDIPAGYEVYKVRAWRQIDTKLLGECPSSEGPHVPDRSDRISGDYLFEELTYGDEFNISGGVRLQAFKEVPGGYELGNRERPNGENNERMATFGAVKLEEGQTMDVTVIVRVYFTKANADAAVQPAGGPRRALTLENLSADGKYYVAEKVVTRTLSSNNVITAVNSVKANREVESVNYVNTMGQVSDRPWQGVNVVVTRYTDGTTKTTKAVY